MRKRKVVQVLIGILLVAALVLVPVACKAEAPEVAPPVAPPEEVVAPAAPEAPTWTGPYKIGVTANLTGVNAAFGASCRAGAEVAVDQINAAGGILGRPLELIVRDDKMDPDEAARVIKQFIFDDKVDAVFLSPPNNCRIPQMRICKENQVLAFCQQGQGFDILNELMYPYYFDLGPTAYQEAFALAKYAATRKDWNSFVTFAPDYDWGHESVGAFSKALQELRPDFECRGNFWPPLEELEFGSHITAIMGTEADVIVTWVFGTTYVGFVKQAGGYGLIDKMDVLSWVHQDMLTEAGKDVPSGLTVEADNEFWTNAKNNNPYYEAFEKAYQAKRGRPSSLGGCQLYDEVMLLMQGIRKANSFDKSDIAKAIEGGTFMTLRGPQFIRPINHVSVAPLYFGTTKYDDTLGYCTVVDVIEIPGAEVMQPDEDYIEYRKEHGIVFKPWHENWWEDLPWAE